MKDSGRYNEKLVLAVLTSNKEYTSIWRVLPDSTCIEGCLCVISYAYAN